ncbi:hypothetical protein D8B29_05630 [Verminephrobacter eiseniae]|nr:hypothetical protein [Verminephrobacter eiseniae]MCW5302362.1 hypothetical protein [Verminephrobacter eiseniae]MCW8179123.1 hypothetical protein [Verminephrobacter eiseniae]MCW8190302.1 hypothetical protein [Verminephrobacter eiseniae]
MQYFGTAITYGSLLEQIERMAGHLRRDCRVAPSDRVVHALTRGLPCQTPSARWWKPAYGGLLKFV